MAMETDRNPGAGQGWARAVRARFTRRCNTVRIKAPSRRGGRQSASAPGAQDLASSRRGPKRGRADGRTDLALAVGLHRSVEAVRAVKARYAEIEELLLQLLSPVKAHPEARLIAKGKLGCRD
jgi:hypothetical protein